MVKSTYEDHQKRMKEILNPRVNPIQRLRNAIRGRIQPRVR